MTNGITSGPARPALTAALSDPTVDQESRDRELLQRLAASPPLAPAPGMAAGPRDWRREDEALRRRPMFGWKVSLILDLLMIAAPIPVVVAVPPFLECRDRQMNVGFFAGESLASCTRKGIRERWHKLDSRLKMMIRDSGH